MIRQKDFHIQNFVFANSDNKGPLHIRNFVHNTLSGQHNICPTSYVLWGYTYLFDALFLP